MNPQHTPTTRHTTHNAPSQLWKRAFIFVVLLVLPLSVYAAGPILVDTEGTGYGVVWYDSYAYYNIESTAEDGTGGELGRYSNEEAAGFVNDAMQVWAGATITVGSSEIGVTSLTPYQGNGLGDIDADNANDHFTYCPPTETCDDELPPFVTGSARSGENPIIFDDDGSITDLIQGSGASDDVLGFAGPRVVQRYDEILYIIEAQGVLNGKFIDCPDGAAYADPCQDPELSLEDFKGVMLHELGHFIGLDHVQLNMSEALEAMNDDYTNAESVPTMFPLYIGGGAQYTLHYDDKVSVGMLYPSSAFQSSFCTISGTVFESDGATELQGVNVIARNIDNPLIDSVSFVSGAYYTGSDSSCDAQFGAYELHGIVPGKRYSIEIERVSQSFTGGSSLEPCDPPQSGFDEETLSGYFYCTSGGGVINAGTVDTTDIITNKSSVGGAGALQDSGGGGCSLIP